MEKATKKTSLKPKIQKTKAKIASTLRGHPAKKLKIIAVTGSNGKSTVANLIHSILTAHKIPTALIVSPTDFPLSAHALHGYLSKSLKSGASYVVVEAPAQVLGKNVFHEIPIHAAVLTNTATDATDIIAHKSTLFQNSPHFIVLDRDDPRYDHFATFPAQTAVSTYGHHKDANTHINRSKLYKKGTEANLSIGPSSFDVATFAVGEEAVAFMAAAVALAALLDIPQDVIIDGIASYEPQA